MNFYKPGQVDKQSNAFLAKLLSSGKVAAKEQKYTNKLIETLAKSFKKRVTDTRLLKFAEAIQR